MARQSKCDALPEHERAKLIGLIAEGRPWRDLSAIFNIPTATIHEWASQHGYTRNPTSTKRLLVEQLMARPEQPVQTVQTEQGQAEQAEQAEQSVVHRPEDIDAAAREDARDMRLGLQAARLALQVSAMGLNEMRKAAVPDYRATKVWSECVSINVATIRKIRGLDDTNTAPVITIERSYGKQS